MVFFFLVTDEPEVDEVPGKRAHLHETLHDWPCSGRDSPRRMWTSAYLTKGESGVGVVFLKKKSNYGI